MFLAILSVIVVAGALCAAALYAVTVLVGAIAWRLLVLLAATAMS
ncbi:hypothetical protein [Bifidobacterium primatium]|nr:hypothetical protein [Bifidobacterium primatium]